MVLNDIYMQSINDCEQAVDLIIDTNEFYNNHVSSNGTVYSIELHSSVIDSSFLKLFMTFESFLECAFICYLMGQPGVNGNSFTIYASPQSEEKALSMITGTSRFADFTNRDTIIKLANNFFEQAGTFSYLNSIASDFEEMKKIRNAISHVSLESGDKFKALVRTKLGAIPPNISTSSFLNTIVPGDTSTFFVHYKNVIVNAIENISKPL